MEIELYADDLHFLGESEQEQLADLCIHGSVYFRIGGLIISDASDDEWCVSASALRFLRSLFAGHVSGEEEHIIPCCGHFMIPAEDGQSVEIIGCNSGIDFGITHKCSDVIFNCGENEVRVSYSDYLKAVIGFAKQILDFYEASPPRALSDDYDRKVFSAFTAEYGRLYKKALSK